MRTRLIALVSFVVATALVACDRSEPEAKRLPPAAATQPVVPPAGEPEVAGQPPDTHPFDDQPATKPWVMPSAEELAVKAAVIDDLLARGKAARGARAADAAVFLGMHKEETSALMAMLPQHIPPLKDPAKMRVHKGSPENICEPFVCSTRRPVYPPWFSRSTQYPSHKAPSRARGGRRRRAWKRS